MRLDERLRGETTNSPKNKIDLAAHIADVREHARGWLQGIEKNGIDHSERLEGYLDLLIPDEFKEQLKPAEVFVLLYAVYLHDIGYKVEGKDGKIREVPEGHPVRSRKYILANPARYLFARFAPMKEGEAPLAAHAVAEVCYGHAPESVCPLRGIRPDFGDQCLCDRTLNLRRLAALLRLADEMDQAYIRLGHQEGHLRGSISLQDIGRDIVRFHWKGDPSVGEKLADLVHDVNTTLRPVNDLLFDWGFPTKTVVLEPPLEKAKRRSYESYIPKHYIAPKCHDEREQDQGLLREFVLEWLVSCHA